MKTRKNKDVCKGWAVKWISDNSLDGHREHLCCDARLPSMIHHDGYRVLVFKSRHEARRYIKNRYGYIAKRPDLKAEPHGWSVPRAVRVQVTVSELSGVGWLRAVRTRFSPKKRHET